MKNAVSGGLARIREINVLPAGICLSALTYSLLPSHGFSDGCRIVFFLLSFFTACILFGRTLAWLMPVEIRGITEFPVLFSMGYFCVSVILLLLCFISPFPIIVNFFATLALAVCSQLAVRWKQDGGATSSVSSEPCSMGSLVCVAISSCAALIWTRPERSLYIIKDDNYIFPQWVDAFIHSGLIAIFSEANGCADLQKAWMAGTRLDFYHYAGYLPSSVLVSMLHDMPIDIYSRFFLPSAFLMAAFSAYIFARQWWSAEAAAAASGALILAPDASWQGIIGDYHYGFHWLIQASPGIGFGLSLLALAWVIMLAACAQGNRPGIICSFLCAGFLIVFKAQLFVSIAFLLWLFPIFFLKGIRVSARIIWFIAAGGAIWGFLYLAPHIKGIPVFNLNSTGMDEIASSIGRLPAGGLLLPLVQNSLPLGVLFAFLYLFLAILGWWGLAWLLVSYMDPTSRRPLVKVLFPIFVFVNYVMGNLILDSTNVTISDEFSHRPFAWPYVIVVSIVSAGLYVILVERQKFRGMAAKVSVIAVLALGFIFPAVLNQKIINPMHWDGVSDIRIDRGFIDCAQFIKDNSQPGDIIQDMNSDPNYVLTSWTGRREWVSLIYPWNTGAKCRNPECRDRLDQIKAWSLMSDRAQIEEFASKGHIRWLVIDPDRGLGWPDALLSRAAFATSGYKVIRFF